VRVGTECGLPYFRFVGSRTMTKTTSVECPDHEFSFLRSDFIVKGRWRRSPSFRCRRFRLVFITVWLCIYSPPQRFRTRTREHSTQSYKYCCSGTIQYNINCIHRIILFRCKHAYAHTHIHTPQPRNSVKTMRTILRRTFRCSALRLRTIRVSAGIRYTVINRSFPSPSKQLFGNSGISFVSGRNVKNRKCSRIPIGRTYTIGISSNSRNNTPTTTSVVITVIIAIIIIAIIVYIILLLSEYLNKKRSCWTAPLYNQ